MVEELGRLRCSDDKRDAAVRRHSTRPYHPPAKVHFAMYATSGVILMMAAIMIFGDRDLTWTWVFPAAAMAGAVYGYLHVRSAKTPGKGFLWVMVQVVCSLGAFALLAVPAQH
jgi:hypothetical protein